MPTIKTNGNNSLEPPRKMKRRSSIFGTVIPNAEKSCEEMATEEQRKYYRMLLEEEINWESMEEDINKRWSDIVARRQSPPEQISEGAIELTEEEIKSLYEDRPDYNQIAQKIDKHFTKKRLLVHKQRHIENAKQILIDRCTCIDVNCRFESAPL